MNATTARSDQLTLSIDGMSCGHCVQTVTKALSGVAGVKVRAVAIGSAELDVSSPSAANDAVAALDGAGYPARVVQPATAAHSVRTGGCGCGPKGCCGSAHPN